MAYASARITSGGRLVIPVEFRRALGIEEGTTVTMVLEDGALRVSTVPEGIRRAQEIFAKYNPRPCVSLVDEFIAERRAEAQRED